MAAKRQGSNFPVLQRQACQEYNHVSKNSSFSLTTHRHVVDFVERVLPKGGLGPDAQRHRLAAALPSRQRAQQSAAGGRGAVGPGLGGLHAQLGDEAEDLQPKLRMLLPSVASHLPCFW